MFSQSGRGINPNQGDVVILQKLTNKDSLMENTWSHQLHPIPLVKKEDIGVMFIRKSCMLHPSKLVINVPPQWRKNKI